MNKLFFLSFAFILFWSCQTTQVAVDYDRGYNFDQIKTYGYYSDNSIRLNQIDSLQFVKILDQELQKRGYIKAENPDVFIGLKVEVGEGRKTNVVNFGVGGGGGPLGVFTNIGIPIDKKVMNYYIQIDWDDAKTKNLIWTGQTGNTLSYSASSEAKANYYNNSIQSLLKKFPPKIKKDKKKGYYD